MAKRPKRQPALETSTSAAPVKQPTGIVSRIKGVQVGPTKPAFGSMLIEKKRKPR